MHSSLDHDWHLSPGEARRLQEVLAGQVVREDHVGTIHTVGGVDLAYPRTAAGVVMGRAAVVVPRSRTWSSSSSRSSRVR
jgi:deoxyinosine 3'endonuclease (endonuclease V)